MAGQRIGLDYAANRYYSSTLGRVLSADPGNAGGLTNPQSLNLYSYVLNDPTNSKDPEGLCTVMIGGITQTPYTPDVTAQQDVASAIGAISAFPYAGGSIPSGVADILAQGAGCQQEQCSLLWRRSRSSSNPGPIDIITFSGGAQAFTSAWKYLTADVQSRIQSITYVAPGGTGQLQAGNPMTADSLGTEVRVLEDAADFVNTGLQFVVGDYSHPNPPNASYIDTGSCGHNAQCIFARFLDWFSSGFSSCPTGYNAVFGAPTSSGIRVVPGSSWWPTFGPVMVYWWELPLTPHVTSTISYDP